MLRLIRNAVLIVASLVIVKSIWTYYNTGSFWVPSFLVSSVQSVAEVVTDIPITTSTKQAEFSSVTEPSEPAYKWFQEGSWHYGAVPPEGVNAIKISENAK